MLLVCVLAVPPLIYIGWRGGEVAKGAPQVGGILLGRLPIQPPPLPYPPEGEGKRMEEGRRREAEPLPFLLSSPLSFPLGAAHMRGRSSPYWLLCFPSWPIRPISLPGGARNPFPVTRYVPGTTGTLPVSDYYRPIYESLPLDHLETPRHVRDLIQDSEQHSVTKSHNSYNTISSTNVKRADPTGSRTM